METDDEFIGYSDISSDDAVFVKLDQNENVIGFSTEIGDGEWVGPACIKKEKITYNSGNVYNILEPHLPIKGIKIRAWDIDTYDDYTRVSKIFNSIINDGQ